MYSVDSALLLSRNVHKVCHYLFSLLLGVIGDHRKALIYTCGSFCASPSFRALTVAPLAGIGLKIMVYLWFTTPT